MRTDSHRGSLRGHTIRAPLGRALRFRPADGRDHAIGGHCHQFAVVFALVFEPSNCCGRGFDLTRDTTRQSPLPFRRPPMPGLRLAGIPGLPARIKIELLALGFRGRHFQANGHVPQLFHHCARRDAASRRACCRETPCLGHREDLVACPPTTARARSRRWGLACSTITAAAEPDARRAIATTRESRFIAHLSGFDETSGLLPAVPKPTGPAYPPARSIPGNRIAVLRHLRSPRAMFGISHQRREEFDRAALVHIPELLRVASRLWGADAGEDLLQETAGLAVVPSLRSYHNCRAWLYKILLFTYSAQNRKRARQPFLVDLDAAGETALLVDAPTPDTLAAEAVKAAFDRLPENFRTLVVLVDVEGLPIASTLPPMTTRPRITSPVRSATRTVLRTTRFARRRTSSHRSSTSSTPSVFRTASTT